MTERSPPQPKRRNRQYTHHKESKENENLDFLHGVKLVRGLLGVALDASSESLGVGGGDSVGLLDELFDLGHDRFLQVGVELLDVDDIPMI